MKKLKELNPKFTIVRGLSDEEQAEVLRSLQFEAVDYTLREGSIGERVIEILKGPNVEEYSEGGFLLQLDKKELEKLNEDLENNELPYIEFYMLDKGYFIAITETIYGEVYYELAKLNGVEAEERKWAVRWIPRGADSSVEPILDCSVLYNTKAESEKAINDLNQKNFNLIEPLEVEHIDVIGILRGGEKCELCGTRH